MPKHEVSFTVPDRPLGKSDVTFKIKRDGEVIGTLKLSNGNAVWVNRNAKWGKKLTWTQLAEIFNNLGVPEK